MLLLVIPGLYLLTVWSVYAPVVVLERPREFRALERSRELVRGNGWRVFAVVFIAWVLTASVITGITFADRSSAEVVRFVVQVVLDTFGLPISALASAVLYFDLRAVWLARNPTPGRSTTEASD